MAYEAESPSTVTGAETERRVVDVPGEAARLLELCEEIDISIDVPVAEQLIRYLDLVLEKNRFLNLTAIRDWDKALVLHLVDSLTILEEFDAFPRGMKEKPFLDMGCGAGFPGIPLAIARPERHGVLCDSVKKKIKAVDEFIEALGLQNRLSTNTERLEVLGTNHRRAFSCITARALAPLPVLVEYAAPLLSKNGHLVVAKGTPTFDEVESGYEAAELCGLEMLSQRVLELPGDYGQRTVFVYGKISEPEIKLPRSIGMATKEPLA